MKEKLKPAETALAAALLITLAFGLNGASEKLCGNWWGAMFPSLSLSAETDDGAAAAAVSGSREGYRLKFKSVEIIDGIRNSIRNGR